MSKGVDNDTEVRSVGFDVREAIIGRRSERVTEEEVRVGRRAERIGGRTVLS